jgi:hypothetical protein
MRALLDLCLKYDYSKFYQVFGQYLKTDTEQYRKVCGDYFLPRPTQFIIHYHPAIRRYVTGVFDIVVKLKGAIR